MADRRGLHHGDVIVSKETVKAITEREKEKSDLAKKVTKSAEKANADEKKRA